MYDLIAVAGRTVLGCEGYRRKLCQIRSIHGAFSSRNDWPSVRPSAEMSFRHAFGVSSNVRLFENRCPLSKRWIFDVSHAELSHVLWLLTV